MTTTYDKNNIRQIYRVQRYAFPVLLEQLSASTKTGKENQIKKTISGLYSEFDYKTQVILNEEAYIEKKAHLKKRYALRQLI